MKSSFLCFVSLLVVQRVISENVQDNGNDTVNEFSEENEGSRALSRRKRFVIFPDGSSLQLGMNTYVYFVLYEIMYFSVP